jgi:SpoVK/Ycf46/Vps4 family AAA+-type ATPase
MDGNIKTFIQNIDSLKNVKDKDGLKSSLIELDNLIGMKKAKDAIIDQLKFLVCQDDFENHMLHCIITGPPGVGKTQLGTVLAKIWNCLGILKTPVIPKLSSESKKSDIIQENERLRTSLNSIALSSSIQRSKIRKMRKQLRLPSGRSGVSKLRTKITPLLLEVYKDSLSIVSEWNSYAKNEKSPGDDNFIRITSRDDYVAKYVGQTGPKTLDVLNSSLGKVLFIDEAYSLFNGEGDTFGKDALNTINKFMSERYKEIIVIFAGYKEKLEGIFEAQAGLRRRCVWTFEVEGYTPKELSKIFKRQVHKDGWKVDDKVTAEFLEMLFSKNTNTFKAFGGDTERLLFYTKLAYGNQRFVQMSLTNKTLNQHMIEEGLKRLKENSNHKDEKHNVMLPMYM